MPTLTTADYLKYANLQMAAEAFIRDEQTLVLASAPEAVIARLIAGNNRSLLFTETQATAFAGQWEVLDQRANTATGFSGTLFKAINRALKRALKGQSHLTFRAPDMPRRRSIQRILSIRGNGIWRGPDAASEKSALAVRRSLLVQGKKRPVDSNGPRSFAGWRRDANYRAQFRRRRASPTRPRPARSMA